VETAEPGFSTWQGEEISISSKHSDWLWDLSNFVYNGYTGGGLLFPGTTTASSIAMATLRMRGSVPSLPAVSSWPAA